jgi:hypothetical protein
MTKGIQAYSDFDYEKAQGFFLQAYGLCPAPSVLYAIAQSIRMDRGPTGTCQQAYLEVLKWVDPTSAIGVAACQNIRECVPPPPQPTPRPEPSGLAGETGQK